MRKHLFKFILYAVFALIGAPVSAQYNPESVTEKNFDESALFFQSSFLNTFGLERYRDISVGLIDEPFLNLQLNPALLPNLGGRHAYFYLDFREERRESLERGIVYPVYDDVRLSSTILPDARGGNNARNEPEPFLSLGALTYPFGKSQRFLVGGTLQLIHKKAPFYTTPYWIYYGRFGYDAFGNAAAERSDIPIIDRQSGADELFVDGQLYSGYAGIQLSDQLSVGASLNGVNFDRDGEYLFANRSPFGTVDPWRYQNYNSRNRSQDYSHIDLNGGIQYHFLAGWSAGVKIGQLDGDAAQVFNSVDSSRYDNVQTASSDNRSHNYNRFITNQQWNQDGQTRYARLNLQGRLGKNARMRAYFRLSKTDIDLRNQSAISDTGFYDSHYVWNADDEYSSRFNSAFSDVRSGSGARDYNSQQGLVNFEWQLTSKNTLTTGIYYSRNHQEIFTSEPVVSSRFSEGFSYSSSYNPDTSFHSNRLAEDKEVAWNYDATTWTVQIPVFSYFQLNDRWRLMVGVNHVEKSWDIKEQTTAFFNERFTEENGETRTERNFAERYTQPRQRRTEEFTDVITSIEARLSDQFRVNLLIDPDFKDSFRIAQWWLTFKTTL